MNTKSDDLHIEILLATYNGENYIEDQLESIIEQSRSDFSILISDDGSTDRTAIILREFADRYPGLITILPPVPRRLGPSGNFARLVDAARADYIFFCDQDDVWFSNKISASMAAMEDMEQRYGRVMPILLHTDLAVVDADLNLVHPSFVQYSGIKPTRNSFSDLLLGNVVTGCTSLANRALYELARPVPVQALMFDHWIAQVAAGLGRIAYIDQATVQYRQHDNNAVGARRAGPSSFAQRVRRTLIGVDILRVLSRYTQHAAELHARYAKRLEPADARKALVLSNVWKMPRFRRLFAIALSGLFKPTFPSNLGLFVLLMRNGQPTRFGR